jgi:hypothetical protein
VAGLSLGGLGPSGVRQSVFVMSAALDHAVRSGRIRSNPARGLGLPRPRRRDYVYLTHGQVLALANEAGRWHLLILVLAYTGLRCRVADDPSGLPAQDAPGDHGACQHHHDAGPLRHLYPGEMDRYADRLDSAAGDAGKAKMRPDDGDDAQGEK